MISDYFTNTLQGKMFKMFRYLIMGYVHIIDLLKVIEFSAKECIEKSKFLTVYSISYYGQIRYADVYKSSKKKDIKEGDKKI